MTSSFENFKVTHSEMSISFRIKFRDETEFLERVFLLATITIETDSIKMLRSFLFLWKLPIVLLNFF